jgi:hypothetical protein
MEHGNKNEDNTEAERMRSLPSEGHRFLAPLQGLV